jgi:3-dehydroquinate synthase
MALGGGVIGDLSGFAAGIVRRGMQLRPGADQPAGAGGFLRRRQDRHQRPHGKNLIGVFHQPDLVLADTDVLDTLPPASSAPAMPKWPNTG